MNFYYLYDDATQPQSSAANWRRYDLEQLMRLEVEEDDGKSKRRVKRRRYVETTNDQA